jgi:hypothetical protein
MSRDEKKNELLAAQNIFIETSLTSLTFGPETIEFLFQSVQLADFSLIEIRLFRLAKPVADRRFM